MTGFALTGLEGRVAVVTGAGRLRSIGRPIAVALAEAGCDIVLTGTGRSPDRYPDDEKAVGWRDIESVAAEVEATGRRAVPIISDVSDAQAVSDLADQVMSELGRVDFVINNAGAARGEDRKPVVEVEVEDWLKVIDVNLNGTFLMCHFFGRKLIEQGNGGAIINMSSIVSKMFPAKAAAYSASKAGIGALTASMAQEVGPHGIRVNAVCPGYIDTYRLDVVPEKVWNKIIDREIPLRRAGTGEDIAYMTTFLCSDQGSWITGQSYNVDGGTAVQH